MEQIFNVYSISLSSSVCVCFIYGIYIYSGRYISHFIFIRLNLSKLGKWCNWTCVIFHLKSWKHMEYLSEIYLGWKWEQLLVAYLENKVLLIMPNNWTCCRNLYFPFWFIPLMTCRGHYMSGKYSFVFFIFISSPCIRGIDSELLFTYSLKCHKYQDYYLYWVFIGLR